MTDVRIYVKATVDSSTCTFRRWKNVPAPVRGELIRKFGNTLRENKEDLAITITRTVGKTIRESRGEVQEAIDMCDFAVGLSRQLYGLTMPSERPDHRIEELWLPLGPIGVITAFNFPVAVWAWNFCIAAVCGNTVIWKPSPKADDVASHVQYLWNQTCTLHDADEWKHLNIVICSSNEAGIELAKSTGVPLISATGSVEMGKVIAPIVASRLGRTILELGGNNAAVVSKHADVDLAVKGCVFSVVGTSGQRCTSLRRIFVHEDVVEAFTFKLISACSTIVAGDPADEGTLMGPLVDYHAYTAMSRAIDQAISQGGKILHGGETEVIEGGEYPVTCIITADEPIEIMRKETFAPIVYIVPYKDFNTALEYVNNVPQGLSASIFTNDFTEAQLFQREAVAGIVNVNTGTSGAEIGGAFGGEKDTGGGRESGSDAWKAYMRRVTSTLNFSGQLPLAQGIKFE